MCLNVYIRNLLIKRPLTQRMIPNSYERLRDVDEHPNLGQGNIFRSVCQEFCSQGGVCLSMLGYHPPGPGRHPHQPDPPNRSMLRDTVNERAVCILLECNLVHFKITETVLDKWQKMKEFGPRHARLLGPNFIFCHCIKLHVLGGGNAK